MARRPKPSAPRRIVGIPLALIPWHRSGDAGGIAVRPARATLGSYDAVDDPLGVRLTKTLDGLHGTLLAGEGPPAGQRWGMKGSPNNSYRGDLGPLQYVAPVSVGAASDGVRAGMATDRALPNTTGPVSSPVQDRLL